MRPWTIRQAHIAERTRLEAIQRRASAADPAFAELLRTHPELIELPEAWISDGCVFVAERQVQTAGFAVVLRHPSGEHELDGLFVEPGEWGLGAGAALVAYCCELVCSQGGNVLHVIGHPNVRGFYERCGFVLLGTKALQFGTGDVMRKDL